MRTPSWAAKGIPTVVPGPKKSPQPPDGISSCGRLVRGVGFAQVGSVQIPVTVPLAISEGETGRAAMLPTKFAPGLLRLNKLKNSAKG